MRETLINLMPKPLIGLFARPYIGGYSIEELFEVVRTLYHRQGVLATLDLLGEDVDSEAKALQYTEWYQSLLDYVASLEEPLDRKTSVSIKLSSLTRVYRLEPQLELDSPLLERNLQALLAKSRQLGVPLTIDMEDHHWTTLTLEVYLRYLQQGYDLGTVLQTCLHRTEADIDALPANARIRLCIGIYREPAALALTDKGAMKDRMIPLGRKLLEKGIYTEFATHDEPVIRRFAEEVILPGKYPPDRYEFQMLLGVPRDELQQKLTRGTYRQGLPPAPVRLYVPFAPIKSDALAYCKRRLIGNPSIVTYGLRNLLTQALAGKRRD